MKNNKENLTPFSSDNQPKNKGIKKGQKHISTLLKKMLAIPAEKYLKGDKTESMITLVAAALKKDKSKVTAEEIMAFNAYIRGLKGDFRFHKDTLDRVYGKATENIELSGKDGESLVKKVYITPEQQQAAMEHINNVIGEG